MEDIETFYKELADEALQYENIGYKSIKIREFVTDLSNNLGEHNLVEFAVYNAFLSQFPSIEVTRNYFHTVCSRGFKCSVDSSNRTWIDARKPKDIRHRKRKFDPTK
jgi:hypothetical protein